MVGEEIIVNAKEQLFNYILVSVVALYAIGHPLITWAFSSRRTNWGNYWIVWFFTLLILAISVTFAIASPEQTMGFFDWIKNLF